MRGPSGKQPARSGKGRMTGKHLPHPVSNEMKDSLSNAVKIFKKADFSPMSERVKRMRDTDLESWKFPPELVKTDMYAFEMPMTALLRYIITDTTQLDELGKDKRVPHLFASFIAVGLLVDAFSNGELDPVRLPFPLSACICETAGNVWTRQSPPLCHMCCYALHRLKENYPSFAAFNISNAWEETTSLEHWQKAYNAIANQLCTPIDVFVGPITQHNCNMLDKLFAARQPAWVETTVTGSTAVDDLLSTFPLPDIDYSPERAEDDDGLPQMLHSTEMDTTTTESVPTTLSAAPPMPAQAPTPAPASAAPPTPAPASAAPPTPAESSAPTNQPRGKKRKPEDESAGTKRKNNDPPSAKKHKTGMAMFDALTLLTEFQLVRQEGTPSDWRATANGTTLHTISSTDSMHGVEQWLDPSNVAIGWRPSKTHPGVFVITAEKKGAVLSEVISSKEVGEPEPYKFVHKGGSSRLVDEQNGTHLFTANCTLELTSTKPTDVLTRMLSIASRIPGCTEMTCQKIEGKHVEVVIKSQATGSDVAAFVTFIFSGCV